MSSLNQFKIIFLGDAGVGKSSIIHRYIMEQFLVNPDSTLGTAFYCKTLMKHGEMVKLNIWDTSGEEKFHPVDESEIGEIESDGLAGVPEFKVFVIVLTFEDQLDFDEVAALEFGLWRDGRALILLGILIDDLPTAS